MSTNESVILGVLNRERNKLVRQLETVEATKAMIALLEEQFKGLTTKR